VRSLPDQNYYELLEIPPDGSPQQVERAYRIARATYQPSSAATYSVFSDEESGAILRRIEEAYAVLSDARLRREYDARLHRREHRTQEMETPAEVEERPEPTPAPPRPASAPLRIPRPSIESDLELDQALEPEGGVYSGAELRRIRLSLGIELDEIASITKINERFLEAIESDGFEELPSAVYLRGFLRQFVKCLGIDPRVVVDSYMARHSERPSP
jgi:curved DNA-binding protein CbpA